MSRSLERLLSVWDQFAFGFLTTVWICAASFAGAILLASIVTVLVRARIFVLSKLLEILGDGLRCTPFLMLLYIFYYCLPVVGIRFSSLVCGLSVLIVYHAAYLAEILKGAWARLPREQEEAAKAFGYHGTKLFLRILSPQIFLSASPLLGNQAIAVVKDSAFLMIITVAELTFVANSVQSRFFIPLESLATAAVLYWLLCASIDYGVHRLNRLAAVRAYD